MQPRLDASMLGLQPDIYQAMAASALQDTRSLDPSKVANQSLLQFQHNVSSGSTSLLQSQMLQQPHSEQNFIQSFPDNQVIAQAQILQQQLQRRLSNGDQQQQLRQQVQQPQQLHSQFQQQQLTKPISNLSQIESSTQSQFPPLQGLASSCPLQQTFSDINHFTASSNSPMPSLLNSFSRDGASQLLNLHGMNSLVSTSPSSKRVALDSQISSRAAAQSAVSQNDNVATPNSKIADLSTFFPPVTGREFSQFQSINDTQNSALFGLNTDSSIMLQNGMPHLMNGGSENESLSMPFATSTYTSGGTDFPLNSDMTTSSCVDESGFLQSSENVDQGNPPTRTFVKVRFLTLESVPFYLISFSCFVTLDMLEEKKYVCFTETIFLSHCCLGVKSLSCTMLSSFSFIFLRLLTRK